MNSPAAHKAQLRRELRARRAAIPAAARRGAARRAAFHLLRLGALRDARSVAVYLAAGSELDTAPLIDALLGAGKRVFVPSIVRGRPGEMRLVSLGAGEVLRSGPHAIREPVRRTRGARPAPDIVVLPLVGFDAAGVRLGSGAGYYDRWLARLQPRPRCIGYGYALQQLPVLPADPWDQRLDAVCTERGLRRCSRR